MARNGYERDFEIYVGNLLGSVTEQDLRNTFKDYKVDKVQLLSSGTKKYAFVQLGSESQVIQAVLDMRNYKLKGQHMVVRAGNTKLNASILNGTVGSRSKNGRSEDADDCPPPLETVYDRPPPLETVSDDPRPLEAVNDGPPPLETVNDDPPPLETVCKTDLPLGDLPPPLEPAFPNSKLFYAVTRQEQESKSPVTLVVADFPFGTTEDELVQLFKDYLPLKASVVVNSRLKNEKTYAYVTVPDPMHADRAVYDLDDFVFNKRKLTVTYFLERGHAY